MSSSSLLVPRKTSSNNLNSEHLTFASIQIQDAGYNLSGNALTLTGGLSFTGTGASTYQITTTFTGTSPISVQNGPLSISGTVRLRASGTIDVGAGAQLTLTGGVSESGGARGLTKAGTGILILDSTGDYTGATTISGGTFQVDGTDSITAITIGSGGTLSGTGTVGTVNSTGGTLDPGDQPGTVGTLTVRSLTLNSASTFHVDLASASSYDQVISASPGSIDLGTATLQLSGSYTPTSADRLTILKNSAGSSISNTFSGLPENALVTSGSSQFKISYLYDDGSTPNNVVLKGLNTTTTTFTSVSPASPTYGQTITFTTEVSASGSTPTAGTTVQLYMDSAFLQSSTIDASGNATFSLPRLTATSHVAYIKYLGNDTYAPSQSTTRSLTVSPATLTVTGITASDKVYDATTSAVIDTSSAALSGVVVPDVVTLSTAGTTGAFVSKGVSTGKDVLVLGLTIGGADAGNYTLVAPILTANITAAHLTVTGVTASGKVYDATTTATIHTSGANLTGVQGTDDVTLGVGDAFGAFATKNVGTAKTVAVAGLTLGGVDAGNYLLTQPAATANITAKGLTGSITANSKVYDETTDATIATRSLAGVLGGDDVSYSGGTATFADFHVGANILVTAAGLGLLGADAGNYTVNSTATTTADIVLRTLTITAKNALKTYGNTVTFAGTEFTAVGLVGVDRVDTVTLVSAGAVDSATAGSSPYAIVASNAQGFELEDYRIEYVDGR